MNSNKIRYKIVTYKLVSQERKSIIIYSARYTLSYPAGKIVKAIPGSLGIFMWENLKQAQTEYHRLDVSNFRPMIIEVKPLTPEYSPVVIADTNMVTLETFYNKPFNINDNYRSPFFCHWIYPPRGTICSDEVEVL